MNRQIFNAAPLMRCNATLDENVNPEPSSFQKLEDAVKQLTQKTTENHNMLKKMEKILEKMATDNETSFSFPIKTTVDLIRIDEQIGENFDAYLSTIKKILMPRGLNKNFTKIVAETVLFDHNYDGLKNRIAFKKYKNLNAVLFECLKREGYDETSYKSDLRDAFKRLKMKTYKQKCLEKKTAASKE